MLYSKILPYEEYTDYAINQETAEYLEKFIIENKIKSVIECGSGLSTILFSYLSLERLSLEHDLKWLNFTKNKLNELQLICNINHCELTDNWFNIENIKLFKSDMLFIDSPPGYICEKSRSPALNKLEKSIKSGTYVVLDDYYRIDENNIVSEWKLKYPNLKEIDVIDSKFGLIVLKFS